MDEREMSAERLAEVRADVDRWVQESAHVESYPGSALSIAERHARDLLAHVDTVTRERDEARAKLRALEAPEAGLPYERGGCGDEGEVGFGCKQGDEAMSEKKKATREVLYSPGFGAGWVSWEHSSDPERKRFMLEHPGLIAAVKAAKPSTSTHEEYQSVWDDHSRPIWGEDGWAQEMDGRRKYPTIRPEKVPDHLRDALIGFVREWHERWPTESLPYFGGLRDLAVFRVPAGARIRIDEYDGSESVVVEGTEDGWM